MNNRENKNIKCPICGDSNAHQLWSIKLKGSRTHKYNPLYFCKTCDFIFQRPEYHEDDNQFKNDLQWHLDVQAMCRKNAERVILQAKRFFPNAKTLLDIGCGIGTAIIVSKDSGLNAQGIEPNPYAVTYAKDNFSLDLMQGFFRASLFANKFDIVIIDNVLEHVTEPAAFLKDVFAVLNPGGILYLAVPGKKSGASGLLQVTHSILFPRSPRSLFFDNDVHINHFSKTSILKLIEPYKATLKFEIRPGAFIIQATK